MSPLHGTSYTWCNEYLTATMFDILQLCCILQLFEPTQEFKSILLHIYTYTNNSFLKKLEGNIIYWLYFLQYNLLRYLIKFYSKICCACNSAYRTKTCRHVAVLCRITDANNGPQTWRLMGIGLYLNTQSRKPTRNGPPDWELTEELTTSGRGGGHCMFRNVK
jgi:hypothetical protein